MKLPGADQSTIAVRCKWCYVICMQPLTCRELAGSQMRARSPLLAALLSCLWLLPRRDMDRMPRRRAVGLLAESAGLASGYTVSPTLPFTCTRVDCSQPNALLCSKCADGFYRPLNEVCS